MNDRDMAPNGFILPGPNPASWQPPPPMIGVPILGPPVAPPAAPRVAPIAPPPTAAAMPPAGVRVPAVAAAGFGPAPAPRVARGPGPGGGGEPTATRAASALTGLSRVTVVGSRRRVDVALPVDATLAELLPTILSLAGDAGHGGATGWVLQRLGEAPLDPGKTVAALGVRDGELLSLAPAHTPLPEAVFDDVVDAVATASRERPDRWSVADTRQFTLAVTAALLGLTAALLAVAGPERVALAAGACAGALLLAGAVWSRAFGNGAVGTVLAAGGVPFAGVAGLFGAGGRSLGYVTSGGLVMASAGLALAAVFAALGVGRRAPQFAAVVALAILGVVAGLATEYAVVAPAGAAAVTLGLTLAAAPLIPRVAFALARIPLPAIPTGVADLGANPARPGAELRSLASVGDQWITALVAAAVSVTLAAEGPLVVAGAWGKVLALVASAVLLLRARLFLGRAQRLWCLCGGVLGVVAVLAGLAVQESAHRLWLLVPAGVVVAATLAVGVRAGERRVGSPLAGRLADMAEIVLVVSVLPLCGEVLGLYGRLRHLSG